jgi:O-antigen/teichoic acid export membrane protein
VTAENSSVDVLRTPEAGGKVIRGGALRGAGYGVGIAVGALTAVFLTRGLGLEDFGRYGTVAAVLGIVSIVTDAGLTAVGSRELAVLQPGRAREELLRHLVGLRILVSTAAVLAATGFVALAGYDRVMVWGTLLGGLGVLLVNTQATAMMPLSIELRLGRVTAIDLLKQVLTLGFVAVLAVAGASLLPYFAVQAVVGALVLVLTPRLIGGVRPMLPRVERAVAVGLLREALPVAVAIAMNVLYLRLLVIMVSLLSDETETGFYATSFRVVEMLIGLPTLVLSVALPLLSVAGAEDLERLRYGLQRTLEVAVVAAAGLVLVTVVVAPAVPLLFGDEFDGAVGMLQIQAWALLPLFVGQALGLALIALRCQRALAIGNGVAVVLVVVVGLLLIPDHGGTGAAVAGVVTEAGLCLMLLLLLARTAPAVMPKLGFAWRPGLALAAGIVPLLVPGLGHVLAGALAVAAFVGTALVAKAVPPEVAEALRRRGPTGGTA